MSTMIGFRQIHIKSDSIELTNKKRHLMDQLVAEATSVPVAPVSAVPRPVVNRGKVNQNVTWDNYEKFQNTPIFSKIQEFTKACSDLAVRQHDQLDITLDQFMPNIEVKESGSKSKGYVFQVRASKYQDNFKKQVIHDMMVKYKIEKAYYIGSENGFIFEFSDTPEKDGILLVESTDEEGEGDESSIRPGNDSQDTLPLDQLIILAKSCTQPERAQSLKHVVFDEYDKEKTYHIAGLLIYNFFATKMQVFLESVITLSNENSQFNLLLTKFDDPIDIWKLFTLEFPKCDFEFATAQGGLRFTIPRTIKRKSMHEVRYSNTKRPKTTQEPE